MLLALIKDVVLFEKNLKSILVDIFAEAAAKFFMKLKSKSHQFFAFFGIDIVHSFSFLVTSVSSFRRFVMI